MQKINRVHSRLRSIPGQTERQRRAKEFVLPGAEDAGARDCLRDEAERLRRVETTAAKRELSLDNGTAGWPGSQPAAFFCVRKTGVRREMQTGNRRRDAKEKTKMNPLSNIWLHPKTSVAGVLIALATVAGVLSQQGVTLGKMGDGSVVAFIGALATALLGLLAKDPDRVAGEKTAGKLGVWLLVAVLTATSLPTVGCTASSNQLKTETSVLATALTSLASALRSSDADTASQLELAAASLNAMVTNWESSTAAGKLNTVAAGVETALAGISSTSKYAALVAIAVTALDAILASTGSAKSARAMALPRPESQLATERALGRQLVRHRMGRSLAGDLKAAWNQAISVGNLHVETLQ